MRFVLLVLRRILGVRSLDDSSYGLHVCLGHGGEGLSIIARSTLADNYLKGGNDFDTAVRIFIQSPSAQEFYPCHTLRFPFCIAAHARLVFGTVSETPVHKSCGPS